MLTSTVIGFPHGGQAPEVKVATATTALPEAGYLDDAQKVTAAEIAAAAGGSRLGTSSTAEILAELRRRRGEV